MASVGPGTVVGGKYELVEPIGQGGMASVWRARHTTLESPVAVKFLETYGTAREKMAKRFLREAKLAAHLKHRNVVHILDYGMLDDGQPFMIMELLRGKSLGDLIEGDTPPTPLEILEIMAQVLGGLAAVHDEGIVHRDVKPDNIFMVKDADGTYPKLLDFGISRDTEGTSGDTRMTNTGAVVGTPLYMSPEQARGMTDLDRRTDIWSVGMILYEALAGELPFESPHMGDVLIKVATEDVPPLGVARPDLPRSVVEAVMKSLGKDRAARFDTAREMREALLEGADEVARGMISPSRSRPSRRLPSQRFDTASAWEEGATEVDPSALATPSVELDEPPAPPPQQTRKWPFAVAGGLLGLVLLSVLAVYGLGLEVRFQSAAADGDLADGDLADGDLADGDLAVEVAAPPAAEADAPVEAARPDAPPDEADEEEAAEAREAEEATELAQAAALEEEPAEAPDEEQVDSPEESAAASAGSEGRRAARRGRGRAARGTAAQRTAPRPDSTETAPRRETREEPPPTQRGGRGRGFLRDLDY